jgi:CheY-like chemotaxis protein/DNA-binding XRE family transcriptional regulator
VLSPSDVADQAGLGVAVRQCRQRLGLTQEELAWRADMHRSYIADIERGGRNITLRSITSLARALAVTVGSLFVTTDLATGVRETNVTGSWRTPANDILLVEDSPEDVELTLRAFKRAKFTNPIKVARDGAEALDRLGLVKNQTKRRVVNLPQLVLLDLGLPKVSGLEVLRRLKGDKRTRDIPVVVLSVSREDRNILECARLGAEHYILKPVDIEIFVSVTPKLNLHLTLGPPADPKAK